jgi:glycosyltransferase involved in cell wall biosynthesis
MKEYPKISVITPSYNQGKYIEQTILSVIGQQYPNLEYIIIDGGSTDETLEVIKKYEKQITYWVSEKDKGQSHAINKGFSMATGEILAWINSDDMYLPSTLSFVANLIDVTVPEIYFGNCILFKEELSELKSYGSNVVDAHSNSLLANVDYIIQPASFWTKLTLDTVGPFREDLHYGFDWEWFLRAQKFRIGFKSVAKCLSLYRLHEAHKSGSGGLKRQQELYDIYCEYTPNAAVLYQNLMKEDFNFHSFRNKAIVRILRQAKLSHSYGDLLKLLKRGKYANFTSKEINEVRSML